MATNLQRRINQALQNNPDTQDFQIEALDNNGVITLKGKVSSKEESQRVEEFVEKQDGVSGVVNEIRVKTGDEGGAEVKVAPNIRPSQPDLIIKEKKE